jgi:4-carboxymuconolactone decarboxylase
MTTKLPSDIHPQTLSRLPPVDPAALDDAGQRIYAEYANQGTGVLAGLQGPLGFWLHAPEFGQHMRAANRVIRFGKDLDRKTVEVAILCAARGMESEFEWTMHEPAALKEGVSQATIDAIKYARPTAGLPADEAYLIEMGRELFRDRRLSSATFAAGVERYGHKRFVYIVGLMGMYAMTAYLLGAVGQELGPDRPSLYPTR